MPQVLVEGICLHLPRDSGSSMFFIRHPIPEKLMDACILIPPVEAWGTLYFMGILLYFLASLQQTEEGTNSYLI